MRRFWLRSGIDGAVRRCRWIAQREVLVLKKAVHVIVDGRTRGQAGRNGRVGSGGAFLRFPGSP
jgi:hypothetical protein